MKLVLDCCPSVTVEFCLVFFDPGLEQWRNLLELLLLYSQQEREPETYHTLYKGRGQSTTLHPIVVSSAGWR